MNHPTTLLCLLCALLVACGSEPTAQVDALLDGASTDATIDATVDAASVSCFTASPPPGSDVPTSDVEANDCSALNFSWSCSAPDNRCFIHEKDDGFIHLECIDLSSCGESQTACECMTQLGYDCPMCFVEEGVLHCGDTLLPENWLCDVATAAPCPPWAGCYPGTSPNNGPPRCFPTLQPQPIGANCMSRNNCVRGAMCHGGRCKKTCDLDCETSGCPPDHQCVTAYEGNTDIGVCEL